MKRFLSVRLPNWPMQVLQRGRGHELQEHLALALHSPHEIAAEVGGVVAAALRRVRESCPAARHGPVLVATNAVAWKQGLRPGMPLEEARSLERNRASVSARGSASQRSAEQLEIVEWDPAEDRQQLRQVAEQLRQFAPVIAFDEEPICETLLLDITGCAELFGGEAKLAAGVYEELRSHGLRAVIGVAGRICIARALSHASAPPRSSADNAGVGQSGPIRILEGASAERLPAGISLRSGRLPAADCQLLEQLGIRHLRRALALPADELPSRLSGAAVLRLQQFHGRAVEHLEPIPELNPVQAVWEGESAAAGLRDLHWILQKLTQEISVQLRERRQMCTVLKVKFRTEAGATAAYEAALVRAEDTAATLGEVLTLRLDYLVQSDRLRRERAAALLRRGRREGSGGELYVAESPVDCAFREASVADGTQAEAVDCAVESGPVVVEFAELEGVPVQRVQISTNSVPIPVHRQRDLFGSEESFEVSEELAALVTRLTGRLGPAAVQRFVERADVRPEFSLQGRPIAEDADDAGQAARVLRELSTPADVSEQEQVAGGAEPCRSARPLRLLPEPLEVTESLRGGATDFTRSVIRAFGTSWSIAEQTGPERIVTAWWSDSPCARDYYRLLAACGSRLWVYRQLDTDRWYLHGFFD